MFSSGVFHVCITTVVKLFVQYLVAICLLTIGLFGQTLELTLQVKLSFIKERFKLLIVLNISVAKIFILSTFKVKALPFSNRNAKQGDNSWKLHKWNC